MIGAVSSLSDFERGVLDFERVLRKDAGAKDEAIWRTFAVSPARYLRFLDVIIKKDAALEHDPLLVRRLRRLRSAQVDLWRARWHPDSRNDREA
jgi:hypothetical protein